MDDEDFNFEECSHRPSAPIKRIDLLPVGVGFARQFAESVGEALSSMEFLLASHANHKVDQAAFHEAAALEIESMTTGE